VAREDFIQNVRLASRLVAPDVQTNGAQLDADQVAGQLKRAALWLSPGYVEGFDPADFADLPQEQRDALADAVARFRAVAGAVPSSTPATPEQFREGLQTLGQVLEQVRSAVRRDWLDALTGLTNDVETWCRKHDWLAHRSEKEVQETLLGAYQAPRLDILVKGTRLMLDPVARFVPGARGLVDLATWPTFEAVRITRGSTGWEVHRDSQPHERIAWSESAFVETVAWLSGRT
jgi:hypothetical protein